MTSNYIYVLLQLNKYVLREKCSIINTSTQLNVFINIIIQLK